MDEADDESERESVSRGWRFAQHYKDRFMPCFLTGWDVGRVAMLAPPLGMISGLAHRR